MDERERAEYETREGAKTVVENPELQNFAMRRILQDYPVNYRVSDLVRDFSNGVPNPQLAEDMRSCVDELVRAGLLYRVGEGDDFMVIPTIPALHLDAVCPVSA